MNKFQKYDRVQVVSPNCEKTYGLFGAVLGYSEGYYGNMNVKVVIDGKENANTYNEDSLKLIGHNYISNEGDIKMIGDYKVATVKFQDGYNKNSTYYYALYDNDVEINDMVAVMTGHHGLAVAKVVAIEDNNLNRIQYNREVVCKIDLDKYNERKNKIAKIKELKNKMNAQVKKLQESAIYEMLAEKDESLKNMLTEYKELVDNKEN